ncbi:MAG: twin-arginine translocase subunit TatC [Deltaproteobacteria bacterium]|nr:MAG: twin-arginine translocase subunit TatC [Deltaproteobacteria bacterium]
MVEPATAPSPETRSREPDPVDDARMPFLEHLRELRQRLRNAIIALIAGFLVAYAFHEEIFVLLLQPLLKVWQARAAEHPDFPAPELYFKSLAEPFWTYLSLSFWAGLFVAAPFAFHQLWKFVAPGLYQHEKRWAIPFAVASGMFFAVGAAFCYFMVLPYAYDFFLGYADANLASMNSLIGEFRIGSADVALRPVLMMQDYLDLSKRLLLGFGLVFEMPLVIFFFSVIGVVTHRGLWKFNRYAIVLAFVFAAILTPPDPVSQVAMAIPLVALYNLSIGVSWLVTRRRERRDAVA